MGSKAAKAYISLGFLAILLVIGVSFQNCGGVMFLGAPKTDPCLLASPPSTCSGPAVVLSKFSLVSSNVQCIICHLNIYGDVTATDPGAFGLHNLSLGKIWGDLVSNDVVPRQCRLNTSTDPTSCTVSNPRHIVEYQTTLPVPAPPAVRVSVANGFQIIDNLQAGGPANTVKFPTFNSGWIQQKVVGSIINLTNGSIVVANTFSGNLVLNARDSAQPFQISGEVFIDGNLVILGRFQGQGTIYVNGSIFIPDDILVGDTGNPDSNKNLFQSYRSALITNNPGVTPEQIAVNNLNLSALRLASAKHIIIGYPGAPPPAGYSTSTAMPPGTLLKNYFPCAGCAMGLDYKYDSYYVTERITSQSADSNGLLNRSRFEGIDGFLSNTTTVLSLAERQVAYQVVPNYLALLKPEFNLPGPTVCTPASPKPYRVQVGSVARIDAVMYAQTSIQGVIVGGGNYLINGGVITRTLNVLGGTAWDIESPAATRSVAVFEITKNCAALGFGTGTYILDETLVNPMNGFPLNENSISYDFRMRNGGTGFEIMRRSDYPQ